MLPSTAASPTGDWEPVLASLHPCLSFPICSPESEPIVWILPDGRSCCMHSVGRRWLATAFPGAPGDLTLYIKPPR